ncbi:MAG: osmotically inducible protein OsmC [Holophagae bacterium]|nr:MAG: osmotically inducible protein OsmC [Holophagae bacterium]
MADGITVTYPGGKRVDAAFDGFRVETDQSEKNGGAGSAPEPFELFLASLATCAGIYVLGFCQNRSIPTDGVRLVQQVERDPEGKILTITIRIEVPPDFPEKYHEALVRVAAKCAVKKTIENPPKFAIETVVVG